MAAPAARLANLVDHADLMGVLYDADGQVIKFGRKRRLASPKQVQVLLGMWGHKCAVPGCGHTRFLQMHHIRDWAEGGTTDLENLVPLCSRC
ncbi:HNH endonuclease, partial [Corynebacterium sp. HMSC08D02]|uniref:HNH endonuclease n=3 Tax=unclassified Corynebacterium TaxID=2624378 RepID=UPI001AF0086B